MTYVIGKSFDSFAQYAVIPNPHTSDKAELLRQVGFDGLMLIGLAIGTFTLGTITSRFWIQAGELNTLALRKKVYQEIVGKDLTWFDTHMGVKAKDPKGAGGLGARLSRCFTI